MHPTWTDYYAGIYRHENDLEIAEQHRIQHHLFGVDTELPLPCCAALAWFGHRLVAWGRGLERKYGEIGVGPRTPLGHV